MTRSPRVLGRCLAVVSALIVAVPATAARPGNGSLPDRRPDFIRLGPKPDNPRDFLLMRHVPDTRCGPGSNGRLTLANTQQYYQLRIDLQRQNINGHVERRQILLPPHSSSRSVGCDKTADKGSDDTQGWRVRHLVFEAPPRQPGPGTSPN